MKHKIKKAFTILEITIVIVIIWVIMWATMKFGWDRIGFLNNKNVKEQFMSNYDSLYSNNMMTSYYMWDIYKELEIKFVLWENNLKYLYNTYGDNYQGTTFVDGWSYEIDDLYLNGESTDMLDIVMSPYVLWCTINDSLESSLAKISILVNKSKSYCFEINSDNCRIQSVSCE